MPLQVHPGRDPRKSPGCSQPAAGRSETRSSAGREPMHPCSPPASPVTDRAPVRRTLFVSFFLKVAVITLQGKRNQRVEQPWGSGDVKWFPSKLSSVRQKSWTNVANFCAQWYVKQYRGNEELIQFSGVVKRVACSADRVGVLWSIYIPIYWDRSFGWALLNNYPFSQPPRFFPKSVMRQPKLLPLQLTTTSW